MSFFSKWSFYYLMCKLQGLSTVEGGECSHPGKSELLCLPNIESLAKLPSELSAERLALTLYLPVDSVRLPPRSLFAGTVRNYYAMTIIYWMAFHWRLNSQVKVIRQFSVKNGKVVLCDFCHCCWFVWKPVKNKSITHPACPPTFNISLSVTKIK